MGRIPPGPAHHSAILPGDFLPKAGGSPVGESVPKVLSGWKIGGPSPSTGTLRHPAFPIIVTSESPGSQQRRSWFGVRLIVGRCQYSPFL